MSQSSLVRTGKRSGLASTHAGKSPARMSRLVALLTLLLLAVSAAPSSAAKTTATRQWSQRPSSVPIDVNQVQAAAEQPGITWHLMSDFRLYPEQENPSRDSYGNPAVWYYLRGTLDRNPQGYSLLSNFDQNWKDNLDWQAWNLGSSVWRLGPAALSDPTQIDQIHVHPYINTTVAVGWQSPIDGVISISGRVTDSDCGGSDGVSWFIDKGATPLASGGVNCTEQLFSDGSGSENLTDVVVSSGEFIYFVVHPRSSTNWDTTLLDITIMSAALEGTSLIYTGAQSLTGVEDEVDGEADLRITTGDHVHLRLPFTNNGGTTIADATIEVLGAHHSSGTPGVSVYDGSAWHTNDDSTLPLIPGVATLDLGTIAPGETSYLDFWIYVTDTDPALRKSSFGQTWIEVLTLTGLWKIGINLSPIDFSDVVLGLDEMEASFCLHNPDNIEVRAYAQYAAGACVKDPRSVFGECGPRTPPNFCDATALRCDSRDSTCDPTAIAPCDPDTPAEAVRNLVDRVNWEFQYDENRLGNEREPDTELLKTRGGYIGVCKHFADLTTGQLRALGLPARSVVGTMMYEEWYKLTLGAPFGGATHAWSEVFLGTGESPLWKQADSTWNKAINQQSAYEDHPIFGKVTDVLADKYPLSSASRTGDTKNRCISACYQTPTDCLKCREQSRMLADEEGSEDISCVEDYTRFYHDAGGIVSGTASTAGGLLLKLNGPTSVTRDETFTASMGITNDTLVPLDVITTTIGLLEYVDSTQDLFEVDPPHHILNNVGAGETITVTWTITPLLAGSGVPLRSWAEAGSLIEFTEQPLVVNEPGTPPDLILTSGCGPGNVSPGQEVTLKASILDDNLQAFSDPATVVTATVVATPTLQYSTTLTLPYCESCEAYQIAFTLPAGAPIGRYEVDLEAAHPSYDPGYATSGFFVVPPLTLSLSADQGVVGVLDTITLTARVQDRGASVAGAGVSAEIITPGGIVTVPLYFDADTETYGLALHPADLAGNLGGEVLAGEWQVHAKADYQGGTGADSAAFTVVGTYPLSEAIISKLETGAKLIWPHMGSGVDHYVVYRSTSPYFYSGGADSAKLTPDVGPAPAAGDDLSFTDAEASAEPGTSYFYVVQPVDAKGQFFIRSNRVAVFNFALTPGTAQ